MFGASGGIGSALMRELKASGCFAAVHGFSRASEPRLDLACEDTVQAVARRLADGPPLRLVVMATGVLHGPGLRPEKSSRELDPAGLQHWFAVNAIGPAIAMKHVLPLLPAQGKSVFAALSARLGSIADNRAGGWHGYRASKAALNQIMRTASIELRRKRPEALCVSLHPGTVDTRLSRPFAKSGLAIQPPRRAAERLLDVIDQLEPSDTGGFFDLAGRRIPW